MGTNTRTVASWHVALERWRGVRTSFWRREEKEKRCTPRYSPLGSSRNRIRSTSTAAKAEFASKPGFMWRKIRVHYYVQLRRRRRRTCAMWTADWPLDIFNYYVGERLLERIRKRIFVWWDGESLMMCIINSFWVVKIFIFQLPIICNV